MTLTIEGRKEHPTIEIRSAFGDDPLVVLNGAEIQMPPNGRSSTGRIAARQHDYAHDFEHDSSYAAVFEVVGITFQEFWGNTVTFKGYLTGKCNYYKDADEEASHDDPDNGLAQVCTDGSCEKEPPHRNMAFMPPKKMIPAGEVEVHVTFGGRE